MSEVSRTLPRMTYAATCSATSLQESAYGAIRFDSLNGQTIAEFGLAAALASLSARQVKALGLMTSGICGLHGSTSSRSADLQSCLVSRLQARLSMLGSTLYTLTWKAWVTPSGVSRSRLRASVRRTSETERSGWPTPQTSDSTGGGQAKRAMGEARHGSNLNDFAMLSGWVTPTVRDWKDTPGMVAQRDGKDRVDQLPRQAYLAGWPTPMAGTPAQNGNNAAGNNDSSRKTVALCGWPTPVARDHFPAHSPEYIAAKKAQGHGMANLNDLVQLTGPARLTASGELLTGSDAQMASGGQLSPHMSRWLMGIPEAWCYCAPTAKAMKKKL